MGRRYGFNAYLSSRVSLGRARNRANLRRLERRIRKEGVLNHIARSWGYVPQNKQLQKIPIQIKEPSSHSWFVRFLIKTVKVITVLTLVLFVSVFTWCWFQYPPGAYSQPPGASRCSPSRSAQRC